MTDDSRDNTVDSANSPNSKARRSRGIERARLARTGKLKFYGVAATLFALLLGVLAGATTFTFGYGKGASYLSNKPETCVNCHVMQPYLNSWQKSSHHHVAVCNDCHLPHNFVGKWVTKADNGFFHSLAFTLQNYHDPIQIKPRNARVAQSSCLHCHHDMAHALLPATADGETMSCVHCHQQVGHALR